MIFHFKEINMADLIADLIGISYLVWTVIRAIKFFIFFERR